MSTTDNTSRKVARNVKRTKGEKVEPEDSVVESVWSYYLRYHFLHFFNTRGSNRRNAFFFWQETGAEWKTWWTTKPVFSQGNNWIPTKNNRLLKSIPRAPGTQVSSSQGKQPATCSHLCLQIRVGPTSLSHLSVCTHALG